MKRAARKSAYTARRSNVYSSRWISSSSLSGLTGLILLASVVQPAWAQKTDTPRPAQCSGECPESSQPDSESSQQASAGDVVPPQIYTVTPGGINIAEGGFTYSKTDLSIGTLSFERHYDGVGFDADLPYNDRDPVAMPFDTHTGHNFDIYVTSSRVLANTQAGTVTYPQHWHTVMHLGAGTSGTYWQSNLTSSGYIVADDMEAEKAELHMTNGAYVYTDQSGTVYRFDPNLHVTGTPPGVDASHSQRIASITYPDGRIRTFSYDGNGLLKLVSDNAGYAVVLDHGINGVVSAACGFSLAQDYVSAVSTCSGAALKVTYGYGSNGLSQVTDVLGGVTQYAATAAGLITCITPPGASGCQISNSYNGRGVTQTMADGAVWYVRATSTFSRDSDYIPSDGDSESIVTDPAGKTSYYAFTGSTPYSATDANGRTTSYRFIGGSNVLEAQNQNVHTGTLLQEVDYPEGNKYLAEYQGPFHAVSKQSYVAKPGSGLADIVKTFGYDLSPCANNVPVAPCTKPVTTTDAKNNVTNFAYFGHGGIQWEMQPAAAPGEARPLKLYTYVQKYAYIKNAAGALVAASGAIWMPGSGTACQTAAGSSTASCDAAGPMMVTTYEYGADGSANNLLVRGRAVTSEGVTHRTCYGYDDRGRRISETNARAGLSVCP